MTNKFQEIIEEKKKNLESQSSQTKDDRPSQKEKIKSVYNGMMGRIDIPRRFENKNFDNFDPDRLDERSGYEKTLGYVKTFAERDESGDWLIMAGGYGLGKTHLALAAGKEILKYYAKQYVENNPHQISYAGSQQKIIFVNSSELVQDIRDSYDSDMKNEEEVMNRYKAAPLLILDDLGTEKASDWQHEKLYIILNYRYNQLKNTIITTNLTTGELKEQVSERVVDRMIEAAGKGEYLWFFEGESYRRKELK